MNFLCDVHIPYRLVTHFLRMAHQAVHVNAILNGSYSKDIDIARFADFNHQIVITKDEDFKNLHFAANTPKLIRVILVNIGTQSLIDVFQIHLFQLEKIQKVDQFYIEIGKHQFIYTTDYTLDQ